MVTLLSRLFIRNRDQYDDPKVRAAYGRLCGGLGIFLNLLMTAGKIIAGHITGSISMVADALNNLSDAGSSVITLVGFKESEKAADEDHPFGHGRSEYISGLIVALLILLMGVELLKESITKVIHPAVVSTSLTAYLILAGSVLIKCYMAFYNSRIGRKIESPAMKAVATDSLSDTVTTSVVILTMIINQFAHVNLDAWGGILVSLIILWAGYGAARDTISPLLGQKPDPSLVSRIREIVVQQPDIIGIHDMMIHDYGPGRLIVSLHAEVPGNADIYRLHDEVDNAEKELEQTLQCTAVIHMDPIAVDNAQIRATYDAVKAFMKEHYPDYSIHDFRMVPGKTHTNLIFDCVVPMEVTDLEAVREQITSDIQAAFPGRFAVVTVEHSFV
ncbi:MAG: cation diffusion facilitator family transporter [Oscillospiraceae bacterium]|nr:cation diffusion facilitator family transporter [Oscillospiraceae bacterium]